MLVSSLMNNLSHATLQTARTYTTYFEMYEFLYLLYCGVLLAVFLKIVEFLKILLLSSLNGEQFDTKSA